MKILDQILSGAGTILSGAASISMFPSSRPPLIKPVVVKIGNLDDDWKKVGGDLRKSISGFERAVDSAKKRLN